MKFLCRARSSLSRLIALLAVVVIVLSQPAPAFSDMGHPKRVPSFVYPYPISTERVEAESLLNDGLNHAYQKDFAVAIAKLKQAADADPTHEMAYRYLGDIYRQVGDPTAAIAAYSEALKYNPYFARLYNSRGEVYLELKDHDKAIADFSQAITVYPEDPVGYYNRGVAHYDLKDYPQSIYDFLDALRINKGYAEAYVGRGKLRQALANFKGAIEDYRTAATLLQTKSEQLLDQGDHDSYQQLQQQSQSLLKQIEEMQTLI